MSIITTIIDGLKPNPSSGLGGANEGYIQGFQDDLIDGIAGGVADKAGGQCLVTENSPLGMTVLVANGVVYVPNADYIEDLASATKYYRVVIKDEDPITIPSNSSGSDCQHGLDVVIDKVEVPNEYASNVATLVLTLGTPGAGAPSLPDNGYRLAEVEVVSGATQIANASITDTRAQIALNTILLPSTLVTLTGSQTLTNKTLTSPVINTGFSGTAKATSAEVATGTDDTKIVTPLAAAPYANSSMARQALINPNMEVNQRYPGTTLVKTVGSDVYFLDHWKTWNAPDTGTLPTITFSQQALTPGELPGSFYALRIATNGAGTSLGVNSYGLVSQAVEFGTRNLCGNGKKLTLSFWARSTIAGKKLGLYFNQGYGTGGSPTATEIITTSAPVTLTSTLTKYTYTITTNTLTGKTFGTANNDTFEAVLCYQWGSTFASTRGLGSAETYVGSGYTEITQVQLCAGDVALPFQPKSFAQELADCQRYTVDMLGGSALANIIVATGECNSTTRLYSSIQFPVTMRVAPTLVAGTASNFSVGYWTGGNIACTAMSLNIATPQMALMNFDVAAGLTANYPARIFRPGTTEKLLFTAEL